ncbi:MAG: sulfite exporter TauE/SafE family protein [Microscillaceae bacterium]|nr:sulfite exporter TauE/SafE family protein [Microscillaceae bacterium]
MDYLIYSAFLVGLMGSLHCVGMCGPLVLAMPIPRKTLYSQLKARLLYNLGRTTTYALLGALVGLVGRAFTLTVSQQWLSILVGILIGFGMALPNRYFQKISLFGPAYQFTSYLRHQFAQLFRQKNLQASFLLGILNGFLPCGLVYLALAGALATGEWGLGVLYMILFGLGTTPLMLAMGLGISLIKPSMRQFLHRSLLPGFTLLLALWFVLRGLNLGVPYLSPQVQAGQAVVQDACCVEEE